MESAEPAFPKEQKPVGGHEEMPQSEPTQPEEEPGVMDEPEPLPSLTAAPEQQPKPEPYVGTKSEEVQLPSLDELNARIRSFVTPETITSFTRKTVRERLEQEFQLPVDSLLPLRQDVNSILAQVVANYEASLATPPTEEATPTEGGGTNKRPREADEEPEARPPRKTRRSVPAQAEEAASESSAEEEEEESEASSEPPRRTARAKARAGAKKEQAALMTRTEFSETAEALSAKIGDFEFNLTPRVFSTGSCGWWFGNKVPFKIGDTEAICLLNVNCTVVGSKQWREGKKKTKKQ